MNKKIAQDYSDIELRSVESLSDEIGTEPVHGVYLVARTYQGGRMVLDLDAHFDRLERSAAALGVPISAPRRKIREVLAGDVRRRSAAAGLERDVRFRVTAVLDGPVAYRVTTEIARDLDPGIRERGVVTAVIRDAARTQATVKSTAWMRRRQSFSGGAQEVYEYLLADSGGSILEGASSNFYAVKEGTLHTAGEGVLEGIARRMVLAVAPGIVPVSLEAVTIEDVVAGKVMEAFISSATRGIVPVRQIDSTELGLPGGTTRAIAEAWERRLEETVTPLL